MFWRHVEALLWKNRKLYYDEQRVSWWFGLLFWPLVRAVIVFFLFGSLGVSSGLTSTIAPLSSWILFSLRYDIPRTDEKIMYSLNKSEYYDPLYRQCRPEGE